jgi:hypothetical protein
MALPTEPDEPRAAADHGPGRGLSGGGRSSDSRCRHLAAGGGQGSPHQQQAAAARTAAPESGLYAKTADEIQGMTVVNTKGEKLGQVDKVVVHKGTDQPYVVVTMGGFLGLTESHVAVPLAEMNLEGNRLRAAVARSADQLAGRGDYAKDAYRSLPGDQKLGQLLTTAGNKAGNARLQRTTFDAFDRNGDRYISGSEATPSLRQQWSQRDANCDGALERSKLSAFEQQLRSGSGAR